eukprot:jgi/Ulvmu1/10690/UM067_0016.1
MCTLSTMHHVTHPQRLVPTWQTMYDSLPAHPPTCIRTMTPSFKYLYVQLYNVVHIPDHCGLWCQVAWLVNNLIRLDPGRTSKPSLVEGCIKFSSTLQMGLVCQRCTMPDPL